MTTELCANCKFNFPSDKIRTIETEEQYACVKSKDYESNKLCKYCWRQHIDAYLSQVCPCCQCEYPKYEFKEKYGSYCGRCFQSDRPKIKCAACGNLNMGASEKCIVCCAEEIEKLVEGITPLVYEQLMEPYVNEPEKIYHMLGDDKMYRGRCPLEGVMKMMYNGNLQPLIKSFVTSEYRNGPIERDNKARIMAYAQLVNDIWSNGQYPYGGLIEMSQA